jgi:hypothetical protein
MGLLAGRSLVRLLLSVIRFLASQAGKFFANLVRTGALVDVPAFHRGVKAADLVNPLAFDDTPPYGFGRGMIHGWLENQFSRCVRRFIIRHPAEEDFLLRE